MRPSILLLSTAFALASLSASAAIVADHPTAAPAPGGPPSIRIAEKSKGDITRAQWTSTAAVKLGGCVPDARVTYMKLCINDCKGKEAALTTTDGTFTKAMKQMIASLPAGTPFIVKVEVKDAKGNLWTVPDASYVLVD